MNTESKRIDSLLDVACTLAAPVTSALSTVAQGDANNQRQGNSIKMIRIDYNMRFYQTLGTTSSAVSQTFRWFLIRYLKTPATSPTTPFGISEFLDVDSAGQYSPLSLANTNYSQNFQILESGTVQLDLPNYTNALTDKTFSHQVTGTLDVGFHQVYNGSASTTLSDSLVVLVVVAQYANNTGGSSGVQYGIRQWYVDN